MIKYFLIFLAFSMGGYAQQEIPSSSVVLEEANKLSQYGVLRESKGFVYLDLDDEYIHSLNKQIQDQGFEAPPYFGKPGLIGAHVTVIYADEFEKYNIKKIQECGEKIFFTLKDCQIVHPLTWKSVDEVYLVSLESPQLDEIRQKYGLPKKQHDFHITIGIKPKFSKSA